MTPLPSNHEITLKDLAFFLRRRWLIALSLFFAGVIIGVLKIAPSLSQIHLEQGILVRSDEGHLTHAHTLALRQRFLSDPFIKRNLILRIGPSRLSPEALEKMIAVKIQSKGGFLGKDAALSERFILGLYVLTSDKTFGREILNAWTDLCLEEAEKLNQIYRDKIKLLEDDIARIKQSLHKNQEDFEKAGLAAQKIHEEFPTLQSFEAYLEQKFETIKKAPGLENASALESNDPKKIYLDLRANLLLYFSTIQSKIRELRLLQQQVLESKSKIVILESMPEVKIILDRQDVLLQLVAVSLALGILLAFAGTALFEIFLSLKKELQSA